MAASFVARRSTHEAPLVASSSEDDADILTRARVLASSPQKAGPPIKRGATALQAISVPDAHLEESSDSDAELLRRSKQAVRQQLSVPPAAPLPSRRRTAGLEMPIAGTPPAAQTRRATGNARPLSGVVAPRSLPARPTTGRATAGQQQQKATSNSDVSDSEEEWSRMLAENPVLPARSSLHKKPVSRAPRVSLGAVTAADSGAAQQRRPTAKPEESSDDDWVQQVVSSQNRRLQQPPAPEPASAPAGSSKRKTAPTSTSAVRPKPVVQTARRSVTAAASPAPPLRPAVAVPAPLETLWEAAAPATNFTTVTNPIWQPQSATAAERSDGRATWQAYQAAAAAAAAATSQPRPRWTGIAESMPSAPPLPDGPGSSTAAAPASRIVQRCQLAESTASDSAHPGGSMPLPVHGEAHQQGASGSAPPPLLLQPPQAAPNTAAPGSWRPQPTNLQAALQAGAADVKAQPAGGAAPEEQRLRAEVGAAVAASADRLTGASRTVLKELETKWSGTWRQSNEDSAAMRKEASKLTAAVAEASASGAAAAAQVQSLIDILAALQDQRTRLEQHPPALATQDGQGGDGRPSSGGDKSSPNGELARLEAKLLTQLQAGLDCGDDCSATDGTARHVFRVDAGMPHSAPCSRHTSPLKQRPKECFNAKDVATEGVSRRTQVLLQLGRHLRALQRLQKQAASLASVRTLHSEVAELRAAQREQGAANLELHDGLVDAQERLARLQRGKDHADSHARCHDTKVAVMDAAASGALDRRLTALERRLDGAAEDASGAAASGRAAQQRLAALEWRLEQVATVCTTGSRQATCRAQQARSALAAVRETAGLAEAKVDAVAGELARLHRRRFGIVDSAEAGMFKSSGIKLRQKTTPWKN